nr:nucleotidyl transferase AbiEii/AbiGii toxin family protein [Mycoplasmopsis citelli]
MNIYFDYPKDYDVVSYILSFIKLEIGKISELIPSSKTIIQPYISQVFPDVFSEKIIVKIVDPIRTFYDKLIILHAEAKRTNGNYKKRYSRHYYDVYKMLESDIKNKSLENFELLKSVIEFKKKFYRSSFPQYDEIYQGKLKLVPSTEVINFYKEDYKKWKKWFLERLLVLIKSLKN